MRTSVSCVCNSIHSPRIRIISMCMAFVSGILFLSLGGCFVAREIDYQFFSMRRAEAIQNMAVLRAIHEDDISVAIEYLDLRIDSAVVASWARLQGLGEDRREDEIRFLNDIKSFRQNYPRTVPSSIGDTMSEEFDEIISKVDKILNGINDLGEIRGVQGRTEVVPVSWEI